MNTTADYLSQLQQDKADLIDNLETKGITRLTGDETFTELVPEVLNIQNGVDITDYIKDNTTGTASTNTYGIIWTSLIKKIPSFTFNNYGVYSNVFYKFQGTEVDISGFSGIVNLNSTFLGCSNLTTIKGLNQNFTLYNFENTFSGCSSLVNLDLSGFNTTNVSSMNNLFKNCISLEYLDIRNFDFTNVTSSSGMFSNVPTNCEIIVHDQTAKDWVLTQRSDFTNVKTIAEYEAEQNA